MRIGNIVISTKKDLNEAKTRELNAIKEKLVSGIQEINKEKGVEAKVETTNLPLHKSLSYLGVPYANYITSRTNENVVRRADLDLLRFWSSELPYAPQAIEYIIKSTWARGWSIELNEGKKPNTTLFEKIEAFFRSANRNRKSLKTVLQSFQRHALKYGNGYAEKIYNKGHNELKEVMLMSPFNTVVIVNKDLQEQGILEVNGYAKVDNVSISDIDQIPKDSILPVWKVIHHQYIDNGEAYGHSGFEYNQQTTMLTLNVLNRNVKKFNNDISHSLHIDMGIGATMADADLFLHRYRTQYLGTNNDGKPLVTFGDIKVTRWTSPDENFRYESYMNQTGKNHAPSLINVAPSEIVNNDAKYSNASQGHITTVLNNIYDWQEAIEDIVNYQIIGELEGIIPDNKTGETSSEKPTYKFVLQRENIFTLYETVDKLGTAVIRGIMSINDARKVLDPRQLKRIEEPWADMHFIVAGQAITVLNEDMTTGSTTDNADVNVKEPKEEDTEDDTEDDSEEEDDTTDTEEEPTEEDSEKRMMNNVIDSITKGKNPNIKGLSDR